MLIMNTVFRSKDERNYFLQGSLIDVSTCVKKGDYNDFLNFCEGNYSDFDEEKITKMNILLVLSKLGYSIESKATYLYNDMIFKIYSSIINNNENNSLCSELTNPFSNFYFDVSVNENDIGIKPFHALLQLENEKVISRSANHDAMLSFFGKDIEITDYVTQAYIIAKFFSSKVMFNNDKNNFVKKMVIN